MQECCILEVSSCETIISLAQYVYLTKLSNECRNNKDYENAAAFLFIRVLLHKVIIEKSRGEVSLVEQDTIENVS